ncbi:MAG TPA: oxidase [Devosia sp.]|nr:oxidase [Devosia sp.]
MSPIRSGMSRRKLLAGTAALGLSGSAAALYFSGSTLAASHGGNANPLKIPPLLEGTLQDGTRTFDLNIQDGQTRFFPDVTTATRGINGSFLGPVLRLRKGETTQFNVTNSLNENTTLHWHGFNLPAAADGGPHQIIRPGQTWSPHFEIREEASTMWYHSHLMGKTAEQVWSGIAGMARIDDPETGSLGLPDTYGVDDIAIALQDRTIFRDGSMPYRPGMHDRMMGYTGQIPMANGTVNAYFDATTSLVRLRLLNGSNGTIYNIGFSDGRRFHKIATDGGLLAAPVELQLMSMGPGERVEILVDLSDGKNVTLTHFNRLSSSRVSPQFAFLELRPTGQLADSGPVPTTLASLAAPDASKAVNTRRFVLNMAGMMMNSRFTINNRQMDINYINETVRKDTSEIWEVSNTSPMSHPFHVHNTQFRILDRNGTPAQAHEAGRKDTVLVAPSETVRLLVRFDKYADPDLPYMYHCHILEHEDAGMMGQFTVV